MIRPNKTFAWLLLSCFVFLDCPATAAEVAVVPFGEMQGVEDGEHRLGGTDRMFLIEDQWEFDRCKLLLPKLPVIELRSDSLLVIMSWKSMKRSLLSVESEGDTLVVRVAQEQPPLISAGHYTPPAFLVYKLPVWPGPVRFELNGEPTFTILRGEPLGERSDELWEEVLRVHSSGGATLPQKIRYFKRLWPSMTEDDIRHRIVHDKDKYRSIDLAPLYQMLFRDLIDVRAKPALPRIFDLIETMGQHDKALGPACGAVVGIGGPEVVALCRDNLRSWNLRSRQSAMGILATLGLPETRVIAHEQLADLDGGVSGGALILLRRIEIGREDVPAMIHALEQTDRFYLMPAESRPRVRYFTGETAKGIIYSFGELGPAAEAALPILERFAADPRLPSPGFRPDAKKAIEKIRSAPLPKSR